MVVLAAAVVATATPMAAAALLINRQRQVRLASRMRSETSGLLLFVIDSSNKLKTISVAQREFVLIVLFSLFLIIIAWV